MTEFGIPKKLRSLIKICMEEKQYQIRIDQTISETFTVETGLKQGHALFLILFNPTLEKTVREKQKETTGREINRQKIKILGFADDINIIGNTRDDIEKTLKALEKSADKIGLKVNVEKTKIMEQLDTEENSMDPEPDPDDWMYEKVNEFKYLGICINAKNDWSKEIGI
ncbi:Reverse transcriptase domain [Cinara cedri]|uniref:Reverse transcriptase domain n=1 Tax=Cinara cedri TaxID=506608 RepID=A0A5E4N710_9HEMI|nr:Reverse transcriptase domain [Cinara cedri]